MTAERKSEMQTNQDPYVFQQLEKELIQKVRAITGSESELELQNAPEHSGADYGFQVIRIARDIGENPAALAQRIALQINANLPQDVQRAIATGPYLNFETNMSTYAPRVIEEILRTGPDFGKENTGKGIVVEIDMSSPNIAKEMTIGHLRSTIIGDSIARIHEALGFTVIKDNHIGDWGTQFGKLIAAMKRYGVSANDLANSDDPIAILQDIYVRFHTEVDSQKGSSRAEYVAQHQTAISKLKLGAELTESERVDVSELLSAVDEISEDIMQRKKISKEDLDMDKVIEDALDRLSTSELENDGRAWFKRLEDGDLEARSTWQLCVDVSMKGFQEIYDFLGVEFDTVKGESFYEEMLPATVQEVRDSSTATVSKGALVVDLSDQNLGSAMVLKSDGATLYMTRDIATALYRESHGVQRAIYVVGEDQKLYFRQLFAILEKMGHPIGRQSTHVYFGMVTLPEGRMSTRKGRVVLLKDVIAEGRSRVSQTLQEKNPTAYSDPQRRLEIVDQITRGAIKWSDLSQDPRKPIEFNWDRALNIQGNSAARVQYAAVRANKIVEAAGPNDTQPEQTSYTIQERELIKALAEYPSVLREAHLNNAPYIVANYLAKVTDLFNRFYDNVSVLKTEEAALRSARLKTVAATSQVITNGLAILGIEVPEEM